MDRSRPDRILAAFEETARSIPRPESAPRGAAIRTRFVPMPLIGAVVIVAVILVAASLLGGLPGRLGTGPGGQATPTGSPTPLPTPGFSLVIYNRAPETVGVGGFTLGPCETGRWSAAEVAAAFATSSSGPTPSGVRGVPTDLKWPHGYTGPLYLVVPPDPSTTVHSTTTAPDPAGLPACTAPSPSPSPAPRPLPSGFVSDTVAGLSFLHPSDWFVAPGPAPVAGRPVPDFYLSNAPLTVGLCPTPDPASGAFGPCQQPSEALPSGGVLVTVSPNFGGLLEGIPPQINVGTPDAPCHGIGGEVQISSVAAGSVITACLVEPGLAANEDRVRTVIDSLERVSAAPPTPAPSPPPEISPSPAPSAASMHVSAVAFFDRRDGLAIGGSPIWPPIRSVVWRTSDGGTSWTKTLLDHPALGPLATLPSGQAWAATDCSADDSGGCVAELLGSTDHGRTWQPLATGTFTSLSFVDPLHGWATGPSGPSALGSISALQAVPILTTSDGGKTWQELSTKACPEWAWPVGVSFVSRSDGWVACTGIPAAGSGPKAVVRTADGGRTWTLVASANPFGASVGTLSIGDYLAGIAMRSDGLGVAWEGRGTSLRTTDGGRAWTTIGPGEFDALIPGPISLFDDQVWTTEVWDGNGQAQRIEQTTNGGKTWRTLATIPAG